MLPANWISDIEVAAGLKPRCGGTYRHFESKEAILVAAVQTLLDDTDVTLSPEWSSFEDAAAEGLGLLDRNSEARRLLFQDLDDFPGLKRKVSEQLIERSYRTAADTARGLSPHIDADALAAVMFGALFSFRVVENILGEPPLGVSDERFIASWSKAFELMISEPTNPTE